MYISLLSMRQSDVHPMLILSWNLNLLSDCENKWWSINDNFMSANEITECVFTRFHAQRLCVFSFSTDLCNALAFCFTSDTKWQVMFILQPFCFAKFTPHFYCSLTAGMHVVLSPPFFYRQLHSIVWVALVWLVLSDLQKRIRACTSTKLLFEQTRHTFARYDYPIYTQPGDCRIRTKGKSMASWCATPDAPLFQQKAVCGLVVKFPVAASHMLAIALATFGPSRNSLWRNCTGSNKFSPPTALHSMVSG